MRLYLLATLVILGGVNNITRAESPRHHEAHEHGKGELNIAIDQKTLMIELSMPAMNIVGFEHKPKNKADEKQVHDAIQKLKDGMALFSPTPAATCSLVSAEIETSLIEDKHHEHSGHHDSEHEEHSDFEGNYLFSCKQPENLISLELKLFKVFPGTEHLATQVISNSGQSGVTLSKKNPIVNLKK